MPLATKPLPFMWYELMTTDAKASIDFYTRVLGWKAAPAGMGPVEYTILSVGERGIGGVFTLTEKMCSEGARPCWVGYVGVPDVDAYSERVKALGGGVHVGPMDLPEVGRFSMVSDPHGAAFVLFKPVSTDSLPELPARTPGAIGWHELHAGDGPAAWTFYSELFGWTKGPAMDMGAMGVYQIFAAGGEDIGGIMTRMPQAPMPFWLYYVTVDGLDAATQRALDAGGKVLHGPMEVPGPMYVMQMFDPLGAVFAMVSDRR